MSEDNTKVEGLLNYLQILGATNKGYRISFGLSNNLVTDGSGVNSIYLCTICNDDIIIPEAGIGQYDIHPEGYYRIANANWDRFEEDVILKCKKLGLIV